MIKPMNDGSFSNLPKTTESDNIICIRYAWLSVVFAINGLFSLYIIYGNPPKELKFTVWIINLVFGIMFIVVNYKNDLVRRSHKIDSNHNLGCYDCLGMIQIIEYKIEPPNLD